MLNLNQIKGAVAETTANDPIKSLRLFGSYADRRQKETRDPGVPVDIVNFSHFF